MKNNLRKIFFCFLLFFSACEESLLHNLTEIEANRLIGILNSEGIEGEKILQTDLKWTLNVEKKDFVKAILLLDSKRLLKDTSTIKKEGSSLLGSNKEKDFYYERALSAELEKTLLTLNGVFDARVHLNVKKDDLLGLRKENENKNSAGVLMVVNEDEIFNESQIKSIISGASGIKKEDVSIVISRIKMSHSKDAESNLIISSEFDNNTQEDFSSSFSFVSFLKGIQKYLYSLVGVVACFFLVVLCRKKINSRKLNLVKTISMISK